jgi:hypothetical protein
VQGLVDGAERRVDGDRIGEVEIVEAVEARAVAPGVEPDHPRAARGKQGRGCRADPGVRPGHHDGLAVEAHGSFLTGV